MEEILHTMINDDLDIHTQTTKKLKKKKKRKT